MANPLPPSLPARTKARKIVITCLVLAIIGVSVIPGFYLEERIRGRAEWREYENAAKQRGVKLDLADYVPPKIPDADNFASIPIFEAVFRASDKSEDIPNPFKLPKPATGEVPKLNNPTKQTLVDLPAWQAYFVETKLLPAASDSPAVDVLTALDQFAEPLAQLRDAGARPHCRFPVHWERGAAASLPHLSLLQDAARLHALRLAAHLALGDRAAAYEDFRDGLRLTTAILEEPSLISGLVRISTFAVMESAVWGGLTRKQWAEPELRKIEGDLAALDWLKDYQFAMRSERGGVNAITDGIIENPHILENFAEKQDAAMRKVLAVYPTGWLYQGKCRMNHFLDELLARIDPGQRRWLSDRPMPSSPKDIKNAVEKIHYALFAVLAPVLEDVEKKYVQAAAVTDQARLACALERFHLSHGDFPKDLAELVPETLPAVPMEIVNGEPYHYWRSDDGSFVLYSVGLDLHDDGGVINPDVSASKQLDWVWRYPAK